MTNWTEIKAFMTCATILYIKFVVTTGIQATKTFDAGGRPPEDRNLPLAQGRREQTYGLVTDDNDEELKKAREVELRWKRIVANDLENLPLALLLFAGGMFAGGDTFIYTATIVLYTTVRCFHTYAYATELQPHRAWCWRIGVVAVLIGAINSLIGVFK